MKTKHETGVRSLGPSATSSRIVSSKVFQKRSTETRIYNIICRQKREREREKKKEKKKKKKKEDELTLHHHLLH